ncbi:MAG: PEP-CTERM sorting domain-containing protein [Phycisphaerales bacterium]|nr:PEP-CTERM sorting domain-containing protein [Phycisphaerales bacterium]
MKIAILAGALALAAGTAARADILANWTFETSGPSLVLNDSTISPSAPAEGGVFAATSIASGMHAATATDWSSPVGNGSTESFSSNNWITGDFYQFTTSTVGYDTLSFAWHQNRSGTGPGTFDLQYSTDGTNFITLLNDYAIPSVVWTSAGAPLPESIFGPVSVPADANNLALVTFRLTAASDPSSPNGTNRIDNISIEGTLIPAPGAMALLGLGGLVIARRRRA